jgi:tRNA(fMet)-specific endonuclease VapC
MRYLLDTCVLSDFVKEEPGTMQRLLRTPAREIAVSSLTVMELRYGFALNPERARKVEPAIVGILDSVAILPFETEDAECAAVIRAELRRRGQPIGAYDFLIAATALRHGLIMVTANQREFDRVSGLVTECWRSI